MAIKCFTDCMLPFCRFGAAHNADCIVPCATMLDFYNGGGIDLACLGAAEVTFSPCPPIDRSFLVSICMYTIQHCEALFVISPSVIVRDICVQVDQEGNVNVHSFPGRQPGCGGFIDISQAAKEVIFAGTFTTGGLKVPSNLCGLTLCIQLFLSYIA